jgi:hypothetical protein
VSRLRSARRASNRKRGAPSRSPNSGLGLLAPAFPGGDELLGLNRKACEQQLIGSGFLRTLNEGGETAPDVTDITPGVPSADGVLSFGVSDPTAARSIPARPHPSAQKPPLRNSVTEAVEVAVTL